MYPRFVPIHRAFIIILALSFPVFPQTAGDKLLGRWYTEECRAAFDFYRCNQEYRARMIALEKPAMIHSKNPVDSLKTRKVNGMVAVYGLTYDPVKNQWVNGKVYNAENGKTYCCNCVLTGKGTLIFRGFLGISLLGGSQTWTRAECAGKR